MSQYDVTSICNALMDLLVQCDEDFLVQSDIHKGVMHLVDGERQNAILNKLEKTNLKTNLGGSSLNAMRSLAHLGAKVGFNGAIGHDIYGEMVEEKMKELGISYNLGRSDTEPTGTCLVLVTPDGERTMNTCLGASRMYSASDIDFDMIRQSKYFHFCGYQWDTENQKDAIKKAISVAKSAGVRISFDVADPFVVDRNKEEFLQLITDSADVVFANQVEAEMLFGGTPEMAAQKISEAGAMAVIKTGSKGAIVRTGSEKHLIPAVQTTVVDTTAAGDMFAGGFLYGLTHNKDVFTAGKMAATLASCVISRVGTSVLAETYAKVKTL
jgi:sugar/nucleoside kinase (ribokinase family)